MSKYEWEEGTIVIPSAEWADFKRKIRERYNRMQKDRYDLALQVYERITEEEEEFSEAFKEETESYGTSVFSRGTSKYPHYDGPSLRRPDREAIKAEIFRKKHGRPLKPRKKGFPKKTNRSKKFALDLIGQPVIRFRNESRTVYWSVRENNRACEEARKHPVAKAMFGALADVDYTRQSGGKIVGNDEYNRDSRAAGGGANYVKNQYGQTQ